MGKIVDTYRELTPGSATAQVRAERGVVGGNSRSECSGGAVHLGRGDCLSAVGGREGAVPYRAGSYDARQVIGGGCGGYPVGAVGGNLAHMRVFDPAARSCIPARSAEIR